jgi:hypothetical protein
MASNPVSQAILCIPHKYFSFDFSEGDAPHQQAETILIYAALRKISENINQWPLSQIVGKKPGHCIVRIQSPQITAILASLAEHEIFPEDLVEGTITPVPAIDVTAHDYTIILKSVAPTCFVTAVNEPIDGKIYSSLQFFCSPSEVNNLSKLPDFITNMPLILRKLVLQPDGSSILTPISVDKSETKSTITDKPSTANSQPTDQAASEKSAKSATNAPNSSSNKTNKLLKHNNKHDKL